MLEGARLHANWPWDRAASCKIEESLRGFLGNERQKFEHVALSNVLRSIQELARYSEREQIFNVVPSEERRIFLDLANDALHDLLDPLVNNHHLCGTGIGMYL